MDQKRHKNFDIVPAAQLKTDAVIQELKAQLGNDLSGYRREILEEKILERVNLFQYTGSHQYLELLKRSPAECRLLMNNLLINAGWFFRDPLVFNRLEYNILPLIIAAKKNKQSNELRIWSIGCGEGEEAYSIAVLVHRALEREGPEWKPYIFAADIDNEALTRARTGIYPVSRFDAVPYAFMTHYFAPTGTGDFFQVRDFIKQMVHFSWADCTASGSIIPRESVFGTFDLVLCRNLLIYFTEQLQTQVLAKIADSAAPNGFLILGESESAAGDRLEDFTRVDANCNLYQHRILSALKKTGTDMRSQLPRLETLNKETS